MKGFAKQNGGAKCWELDNLNGFAQLSLKKLKFGDARGNSYVVDELIISQ